MGDIFPSCFEMTRIIESWLVWKILCRFQSSQLRIWFQVYLFNPPIWHIVRVQRNVYKGNSCEIGFLRGQQVQALSGQFDPSPKLLSTVSVGSFFVYLSTGSIIAISWGWNLSSVFHIIWGVFIKHNCAFVVIFDSQEAFDASLQSEERYPVGFPKVFISRTSSTSTWNHVKLTVHFHLFMGTSGCFCFLQIMVVVSIRYHVSSS